MSVVVAPTSMCAEVLCRFRCLWAEQSAVDVAHRRVDHARIRDSSFRRLFLKVCGSTVLCFVGVIPSYRYYGQIKQLIDWLIKSCVYKYNINQRDVTLIKQAEIRYGNGISDCSYNFQCVTDSQLLQINKYNLLIFTVVSKLQCKYLHSFLNFTNTNIDSRDCVLLLRFFIEHISFTSCIFRARFVVPVKRLSVGEQVETILLVRRANLPNSD